MVSFDSHRPYNVYWISCCELQDGLFTLILIHHTMSFVIHETYCMIVFFDSSWPYNSSIISWRMLQDGLLSFPKTKQCIFALIPKGHTMSPGFHDAYQKMVYFDSHRSYTVSWISLRILQDD